MTFDSLVAINKLPHLSTIRSSNDHTSGQHKGAISPIAAVADNDQSVGLMLEHLSHSPVWKESVVGLFWRMMRKTDPITWMHTARPYMWPGRYVKRNMVLHDMYSTSGVLRTIELILGLPPMSQYDAAAVPLYDCFNDKPDLTQFTAVPGKSRLWKNVTWPIMKAAGRSSKILTWRRKTPCPTWN